MRKRNRLESGDSLSDGDVALGEYEPPRKIQTPVVAKERFFFARDFCPSPMVKALRFELADHHESPQLFVEPVSPIVSLSKHTTW